MIAVVLSLLGLWGCLSIYNATIYSGEPFILAARQFAWLAAGILVFVAVSMADFGWFSRNAPYLAVPVFLALLVLLVLDMRVNGMKGWFSVSTGFGRFSLQPSEFGKPVFILLLCWLHKKYPSWKGSIILVAVAAAWMVAVAAEPDFGTALVYFSAFAAFMFMSRWKPGYMVVLFLIALPVAVWIASSDDFVVKRRILGFLYPEEYSSNAGWHVLQFRYALARGGFLGAGWGESLWSNSFLPLAPSDSAFASLVEAVGFAGAFPVIAGFSLLLIMGFRLSGMIRDESASLYVAVFSVTLCVQAFIHISVNLGLFPTTGVTLPMFSYGGSSMMSTMLGMGILAGSYRMRERRAEQS